MTDLHLSHAAARTLMLAAQGLDRRPRRRARKADVLAAIRRMGVLQIDTISVVARSPYLVLWSRIGDYDPRWLDALLAERKLFEYWSHEACFVPIEDYPLYRHRMLDPSWAGWRYAHTFMDAHRDDAARLLQHVREQGPVRSSDFERKDERGTWWDWKPEKRMLESLFTAGELMIARREGFQRIYDLRERILPSWDDARLPSADEVRRTLVLKAVRSMGIAKAKWVADYFRMDKTSTKLIPDRLADEGALMRVAVEGWKEPAFVHPDHAETMRSAAAGRGKPVLTTLLSPFDPLIWDRKRASEVFGFDYRIEVYVPGPKRVYGYYVLPILHRGRLVGRLDAKAHRKDGVFEVKALYLEPGVRLTDRMTADVASAIAECARWHGTPRVTLRRADPPDALPRLQAALKSATEVTT
ncbi:winged helix-turn-helix domain-containing protein [Longimicrobium sp.]|uniref:winged helix-turn-helix domain-containing protein n=1 Tax=Longimicrobium sp. TaxID=2029185 RepID=UPI002E35F028|nr:crosslink repair DNA glycosylase YcaQ family protein [Longimicrobium sp.]HEX6042487.1 crosslink repair DNA glycosylase YcaQ family protein [Longimicrobium sp.]